MVTPPQAFVWPGESLDFGLQYRAAGPPKARSSAAPFLQLPQVPGLCQIHRLQQFGAAPGALQPGHLSHRGGAAGGAAQQLERGALADPGRWAGRVPAPGAQRGVGCRGARALWEARGPAADAAGHPGVQWLPQQRGNKPTWPCRRGMWGSQDKERTKVGLLPTSVEMGSNFVSLNSWKFEVSLLRTSNFVVPFDTPTV